MTLSSKEQKILRELAQKYMEIAVLPVQREQKAGAQSLANAAADVEYGPDSLA